MWLISIPRVWVKYDTGDGFRKTSTHLRTRYLYLYLRYISKVSSPTLLGPKYSLHGLGRASVHPDTLRWSEPELMQFRPFGLFGPSTWHLVPPGGGRERNKRQQPTPFLQRTVTYCLQSLVIAKRYIRYRLSHVNDNLQMAQM